MIVGFVMTCAGLLVTLSGNIFDLPGLGGVAKMIASTGFMIMALGAGALRGSYGRVVLLALFFSWWGDLFLIFSGKNYFLAGLVAFFLGHLCFGGAFLAHGVRWSWAAAALVVFALPVAVIVQWLNPHLGDMWAPVYAYIMVITLMVALAAGAVGRGGTGWILAGALLFYVSDVFVARQAFVTRDSLNRLIGLPLYFGAQVVFAYTISRVHPALTQDRGQGAPPAGG